MPGRFVQAEQLAGDGTHGAHPPGTDAAGPSLKFSMEPWRLIRLIGPDRSDVTDMLLVHAAALLTFLK